MKPSPSSTPGASLGVIDGDVVGLREARLALTSTGRERSARGAANAGSASFRSSVEGLATAGAGGWGVLVTSLEACFGDSDRGRGTTRPLHFEWGARTP